MPVAADAVGAPEFRRRMGSLGPFGQRPSVAVALSGGPDSLAAAVLLSAWLGHRGGRGSALIVDHGLRSAAALEAEWAAAAARALGLEPRILRWHAPPRAAPASASATKVSQASARAARYALLDAACRDLGCLHLVVAHHAEDLGRTLAMRRRRGPGRGLAGMPAVRELDHCRILRPLLGVPAARLRATARALGRGWIEDPSNRAEAYERSRTIPEPADRQAVDERVWAEIADARWFARHARRHRDGWLLLDAVALDGFATDAAARRLAAASAHVGGARHVPSVRRARAVTAQLNGKSARISLGGAVIGREHDALVLRAEGRRARSAHALAGVPFTPDDVVSHASALIW